VKLYQATRVFPFHDSCFSISPVMLPGTDYTVLRDYDPETFAELDEKLGQEPAPRAVVTTAMCEELILGRVCWFNVLLLLAVPGGIAAWMALRRAVGLRKRVALAGLPFARIHAGTVRLAGILRAHGGRCYLEEISSGRRVSLEAGLSSLPPPGIAVTLVGEALDQVPDPRSEGYRSMQELWRVRPDEICRHGETPVLRPELHLPRGLRTWRWLVILLLLAGLVGVAWPSYFKWCRCVWPG
jgi:hypothetical protein